jgi:hypothetical protein
MPTPLTYEHHERAVKKEFARPEARLAERKFELVWELLVAVGLCERCTSV